MFYSFATLLLTLSSILSNTIPSQVTINIDEMIQIFFWSFRPVICGSLPLCKWIGCQQTSKLNIIILKTQNVNMQMWYAIGLSFWTSNFIVITHFKLWNWIPKSISMSFSVWYFSFSNKTFVFFVAMGIILLFSLNMIWFREANNNCTSVDEVMCQ